MKAFLVACFALFASAAAEAQTSINLPLPTLNPTYYTMANCKYAVKPLTTATGFTTDGLYVTARGQGKVACGHSGRDANIQYYSYCVDLVWDLAGNLISVTPGCTFSTLILQSAGVSYDGPAGYSEYTITISYYGYIAQRYPVLVTP